MSHNLCWSQHIQEVCNKAKKALGIIYRNISSHTNDPSTIFRLYFALVRPHLEYAAQVWNPHLEKDILCLEKVQKFALRICIKDYHESYENLLEFCKVPSLKKRRLFLCLCTFYCIKNNLIYFPCGSVFPPTMSFSCSRRYNQVYRVLVFQHKILADTLWAGAAGRSGLTLQGWVHGPCRHLKSIRSGFVSSMP